MYKFEPHRTNNKASLLRKNRKKNVPQRVSLPRGSLGPKRDVWPVYAMLLLRLMHWLSSAEGRANR